MDLPLIKNHLTFVLSNKKEKITEMMMNFEYVLVKQNVLVHIASETKCIELLKNEIQEKAKKGMEYIFIPHINGFLETEAEEKIIEILYQLSQSTSSSIFIGYYTSRDNQPTHSDAKELLKNSHVKVSFILGFYEDQWYPIKTRHVMD